MRKVITILMTFIMTFLFTACGNTASTQASSTQNESAASSQSSSTASAISNTDSSAPGTTSVASNSQDEVSQEPNLGISIPKYISQMDTYIDYFNKDYTDTPKLFGAVSKVPQNPGTGTYYTGTPSPNIRFLINGDNNGELTGVEILTDKASVSDNTEFKYVSYYYYLSAVIIDEDSADKLVDDLHLSDYENGKTYTVSYKNAKYTFAPTDDALDFFIEPIT